MSLSLQFYHKIRSSRPSTPAIRLPHPWFCILWLTEGNICADLDLHASESSLLDVSEWILAPIVWVKHHKETKVKVSLLSSMLVGLADMWS